MKLIFIIVPLIVYYFFSGCTPQAATGTLLSPSKNSSSTDDNLLNPDNGTLDIQPDNSEMVMNIDDSDTVEITGKCADLDRKNNRILVEVFAGEDESAEPYISNSLSDKCQTDISGLPITDKCFWVTKGVGLVEDADLITQRSFPQCHDGRFGFSIKLGKVLVNSGGAPNSKYTVRFKLRTLDGILSDTIWSRTYVFRSLNVPAINSATFTATPSMQCSVKTSPARFNSNILYTLTRSSTDSAGVVKNWTSYLNQSTATTVDGLSVFSWNDTSLANIILQGLTYSYTLSSIESLYQATYTLPLTAPTASSSVVACVSEALKLTSSPPTLNTCYVRLADTAVANPLWDASGGVGPVTYEWGYSTVANWVGPDSSAQVGYASTCFDEIVCTQAALASNTTYYFAVREIGSDGQKSKWSEVVQCRPL